MTDRALDDAVLDGLRTACDGRARPAETADAVAGVSARYVASPGSTAQTGDVLRLAAEHGLTVVPRGGGTKLGWGMPPTAVDVVLDTTAMTGVVDHAAGDLVAVVRAGTPLGELQACLAAAQQQLAVDAMLPGATVGGAVAAGTSGPRRVLYGTVRDLLIGVTFVRADGVVAKAGGTVVKNVAGYDFGKLLTGSFGTLGVVTEAVFRLHPVPASRRVVTLRTDDVAAAARAALAVLGSQLVPTAVELTAGVDGPVTLTVLLEGIEAGVGGRADGARDLLGAGGGTVDVGEDVPDDFAAYPFGSDGTGLKATASLTGVGALLAAARETARREGVDLRVRGSAAGVLYAGLPPGAEPAAAAAVVEALRAAATAHDGTVTVLTAPPDVRDRVDVWGPVPGLTLMRRLKDEMDPAHRVSPGRFVGGI